MKEPQEDLMHPLKIKSSDYYKNKISSESTAFLRNLEGQCKINQHQLLQIDYLKIVFLLIPTVLTVIGFVFVYHYQNIRAWLSFKRVRKQTDYSKATHIYVKSASGVDSICKIYTVTTALRSFTLFKFQELIYQLTEDGYLPLGPHVKELAQQYLNNDSWKQGLKQGEVREGAKLYGKNQHLVRTPPYHEYMFKALTNFKISILYLNITITLAEYSLQYGLILIGFSLLTIHVNYYLIWKFYAKIKEIAQKDYKVSVIRQGRQVQLPKSELIPGDVFLVEGEVPCDSIVLIGSAFVSEVGFTGQNIPVGKFALQKVSRAFESQHWLYEGSALVTCKEGTMAVAMNTAFSTRKGKIIRKILHGSDATSEFFNSMLPFIGQVVIVHILLFGIFFNYMFADINNSTVIWLRFGEFMVSSIPGFLQIEEGLFKSIFLIRLNNLGVIGTNAQKTIQSSRTEVVCFDKTGTLTQNQLQIQGVLVFDEASQTLQKKQIQFIMENYLLRSLFASCHAVQKVNCNFHGDEIDLKMFYAANVILRDEGINEGTIFQVQSREGTNINIEVLRVHQFQSKFQSMSVIARDKNSNKTYVFAKGAPEKMHSFSTVKIPNFSQIVRQLSLEGFRSIAVSVKTVESGDVLQWDRQKCLQGTSLIGIVTFANALKEDAAETISVLSSAAIRTKMITGDNIFVAAQTALSLQMAKNRRILVLQGSRLQQNGSICAVSVSKEGDRIKQEEMNFPSVTPQTFSGMSIAVDNEFLLKRPDFFNTDITVYARATPQSKTLIVKNQLQKLSQNYKGRNWKSRIFGGRIRKLAMVGDGANDLMAIRQADVGIGISDSDAVYGSDFTISCLEQIPLIIRESRSGQQRLLQLIQYYYIYRFMDMTCKILQTEDFAIYPPNAGIFRNFLTEYALCVILAFAQTSNTLSKYYPNFNMLSLQNQLIYWGSSLIVAIGISTDYYYYRSTPDFVPNPDRSKLGWNNKTGSFTLLLNIVLSIAINISVVQQRPWKQRIWKNAPSMVMLAVNAVFIVVVLFNTKHLSALGLQYIDEIEALKCFFIAIAFGVLCYLYNAFIQSRHMYRYQE